MARYSASIKARLLDKVERDARMLIYPARPHPLDIFGTPPLCALWNNTSGYFFGVVEL